MIRWLKQEAINKKWIISIWLLPVLVIGAFCHIAFLPLAHNVGQLQEQVQFMERNVYQKAWLDSLETMLKQQNRELISYLSRFKKKTIPIEPPENSADNIRRFFTASGLKVIRISFSSSGDHTLSRLSVKLDGSAQYSYLMSFFKKLKKEFPQYFIERMSVRRGRSDSDIAYSITLGAFILSPGQGQ